MKQDSKIEGHDDLMRDGGTNAVLSTDYAAYERWKRNQGLANRVVHIERKIEDVESKLDSILALLTKATQ